MAHFAKLDGNNTVTQVLVVADSDSGGGTLASESVGITFCRNHVGDNSSNWKQTSYNKNFRGNYAGIGYTYMTGVRTLGVASTDIFIEPQSGYWPSWSIGIHTARWFAPLVGPPELTPSEASANKFYCWDEDGYQADTNDPKTVGWALSSYS
tara:strand:- start:216 stop:671 length:456 start_codon:yes stop_codon:yes gene_type:complete